MNAAERALVNRFRAKSSIAQPELNKRVLAAYRILKGTFTEDEWTEAIEKGFAEQLIDVMVSDDTAFSPVRSFLQVSVLDAAENWAAALPSFAKAPIFNRLSLRIVEAVLKLETRVVQGLRDEVRKTMIDAVRAGLEAGKNPRLIARRLPDVIGLGSTQQQAVLNFRAELEAGDRAALRRQLGKGVIKTPDGTQIVRPGHAGGKGLKKSLLKDLDRSLGSKDITAGKIDQAVEAYRQRLLALNTEAHTKTIALDSQRLAQRLSWQNSIDQQIVEESRLQRTWIGMNDGREREEHLVMNGQTIPWNGVYSNGQSIPGEDDYNCRCIEEITYAPPSKG